MLLIIGILGILLLVVLSTVAGAFGGRYLVSRQQTSLRDTYRAASGACAEATGRANRVAARMEVEVGSIVASWPLVRQESHDARHTAQLATEAVRAATEAAEEAVRRTGELEQGIASALSVSIPRRN